MMLLTPSSGEKILTPFTCCGIDITEYNDDYDDGGESVFELRISLSECPWCRMGPRNRDSLRVHPGL